MPSKQPRRFRANLDVLAFTAVSNDLEWMRCQSCDRFLQLHQPDEMSPFRLLGLCEDCRGLFLILMEDGLKDAIMISLHTSEWYQAIVQADDLQAVGRSDIEVIRQAD